MRTRSAHDTKRLFRRFLSTTSSTSAPALYPIRTLIRFCCLWRLARIPQNDTLLLTYLSKIRAFACSLHFAVCRSVPFRRFFFRECPHQGGRLAVRAGDRASRSGVSAAMSGEDERASRPRGAPSPPDVPSTSSSGPRDTARPEDAEARSPRSRERLARAKAEVAALAARVRGHDPSAISGVVSFAPSDPRVMAAPLDASGARVYDRDRLGSHGTLSRRGDSWWFFDTHPEFVRETLASDAAVMRCPHLIGNRPTRAPHVIVTERRANDVTGAGGFLRDPNDSTSRARLAAARPSLRRTAHCCECWERLEVKRARAAVACYACGEAFPMPKTEPFPLLCDPKIAMTLKRDASAAATSRAAAVVDVCFLCAPDWKETRALEDVSRNQIAGLDARHATYDARSRAFAKLPLAARRRRARRAKRVRANARRVSFRNRRRRMCRGNVRRACHPRCGKNVRTAQIPRHIWRRHIADIAAVAASAAETAESLTADLLRKTRAAEAIKGKKARRSRLRGGRWIRRRPRRRRRRRRRHRRRRHRDRFE